MKKKTYDLNRQVRKPIVHSAGGHNCGSTCGNIDVVGEGKEKYPLPSAEDLINNVVKRAEGQIGKKPRKTRSRRGKTAKEGDTGSKAITFESLTGNNPLGGIVRIIPRLPDETDDELGRTLVEGADGLQQLMTGRKFDGLLDSRFGEMVGSVTWAKKHMAAKYQPAVGSLAMHINQLQTRYKEVLPEVVKQLAAKNPGVPLPALLEHAVKFLDQELMQILFILKVYTDSFGQYRDGVYAEILDAVAFFYEQAFLLFQTLNPADASQEDKKGQLEPQLDTHSFQVGDVFIARVTSMSLATIPGSKGPVGAHALQIPFDMLDILALMFPLFAHEFRHNVFHDVKGLEDELVAAVKDAVVKAHKDGSLKLKSEETKLGNAKVKTIDLLVRMIVDSIGEIDADISGGVLLSGPAYLYNMIMSFPAMLIRDTGVKDAKKLLRTSSFYTLEEQEDGSTAMRFEPHPPDYIRSYIVAAALDEIGFGNEAKECRTLTDFAVGKPLPDAITWTDAEEKVKMTISIPVEDIKAAAPVVAKALIQTKLKSLGDRSTGDMLNWTARREEKVQKLVKQLVAGKSEIPEDVGTVYATYIGSAATLAYWQLVNEGGDPVETAKKVNKLGMCMVGRLRKQVQSQ